MQEPGHAGRVLSYDADMSKKPKIETKVVQLYMGKRLLGKNDAKKLAQLESEGWEVLEKSASQTWFGENNGFVTYTLVRQKMSKRERARELSS